jgi:formate dehydrogenase subunit delta
VSADNAERLVYMANQIAAFFAVQKGDRALKVADHLTSFWTPPMRRAIVAHLEAGGAGLSPLAADAVARLASNSTKGLECAMNTAGERSPGHTPGDDAG